MAFKGKVVIALIPARAGSKGVKQKNLRMLLGKPLLAHTIQAAHDAARIDRVYVSSDDADALRLAREMGADVVQRAASAATDSATASEVVWDFVRQIPEELTAENPYLVFLQPTSPLRTGNHIDAAFTVMTSTDSNICLSVTELKKTPFKSFTLTADGRLQSLFDEHLTNANRQTLPVAFHPNGAIYIFPLAEFLARTSIPSNGGAPYIMSEQESIDIDTEEDFAMVEKLCRAN
ncbi:acylneuraminate cytidylyltransferase family protein [Azonexus hydrophilus]|uniref:Acylneuraminate cytidylyltransferase family protein n=1 Tax=Azonexus hydrophilus TaxID=418702 RepID=A0ABZ2XI39_9RHOO|nr:acylneuraminate cytidylyltransferase family protein [Dechloromonas sp.]